jgi:hypothetical protein
MLTHWPCCLGGMSRCDWVGCVRCMSVYTGGLQAGRRTVCVSYVGGISGCGWSACYLALLTAAEVAAAAGTAAA